MPVEYHNIYCLSIPIMAGNSYLYICRIDKVWGVDLRLWLGLDTSAAIPRCGDNLIAVLTASLRFSYIHLPKRSGFGALSGRNDTIELHRIADSAMRTKAGSVPI